MVSLILLQILHIPGDIGMQKDSIRLLNQSSASTFLLARCFQHIQVQSSVQIVGSDAGVDNKVKQVFNAKGGHVVASKVVIHVATVFLEKLQRTWVVQLHGLGWEKVEWRGGWGTQEVSCED